MTEQDNGLEAAPKKEEDQDGIIVTKHEFPEKTEFTENDIEALEELANHCPPLTSRGMYWNWTESGQIAFKVCPPGSSGLARWTCGDNAQWMFEMPNLGECHSTWLSRLETLMHSHGWVKAISSELAMMTASKMLYGGDLPVVNGIIQGQAHHLRQELYKIPSQAEKELRVSNLLENTLKTVSNLLEPKQLNAWKDLSGEKRAALATALMLGLEETTLLLAETINNEKHLIKSAHNVLASIKVLRSRNARDQEFSETEGEKLTLTSEGLQETSVNGAARVAFIKFNNLDKILPGMGPFFINSRVIHTVVPEYQRRKLHNPLKITLQHLRLRNVMNPVCASWDFVQRRWSNQDCRVVQTNSTHTSCECNKISNYAILMEDNPYAQPQESSEERDQLILMIVLICVALSLSVALIVVIVVAKKKSLKSSKKCDYFDFYSNTTSPPTVSTVYTESPSTVYTIKGNNLHNNLTVANSYDIAAATGGAPPKRNVIYQSTRLTNQQQAVRPISAHIYHEILDNPHIQMNHSRSVSDATVASELSEEEFLRNRPDYFAANRNNLPLQLVLSQRRREGGAIAQPQTLTRARPIMYPVMAEQQTSAVAIALQEGDQLVRLNMEEQQFPYSPEENFMHHQQQQQQYQQQQLRI